MSSKGRARGRKAAAVTTEVTKENIVDLTSTGKGKDRGLQIKERRRSKRRSASTNENGISETGVVAPAKRGRGKATRDKESTPVVEEPIAPVPIVEKETKSKRGAKKLSPITTTETKTTEFAQEHVVGMYMGLSTISETAKSKTRSATANENSTSETGVVVFAKRDRGKTTRDKESTPVEKELIPPVPVVEKETKSKRGAKKLSPTTTTETRTAEFTQEHVVGMYMGLSTISETTKSKTRSATANENSTSETGVVVFAKRDRGKTTRDKESTPVEKELIPPVPIVENLTKSKRGAKKLSPTTTTETQITEVTQENVVGMYMGLTTISKTTKSKTRSATANENGTSETGVVVFAKRDRGKTTRDKESTPVEEEPFPPVPIVEKETKPKRRPTTTTETRKADEVTVESKLPPKKGRGKKVAAHERDSEETKDEVVKRKKEAEEKCGVKKYKIEEVTEDAETNNRDDVNMKQESAEIVGDEAKVESSQTAVKRGRVMKVVEEIEEKHIHLDVYSGENHEDSDYRPEEDISSNNSIPEYNSTKQSNISHGMNVTKSVNVADHEDSDYRPEEDISGIDSIPEYNSTKQSNISRGMDVTKTVNVADHEDSDYRPEEDISGIVSIPEYNSTKQSNISRGMDVTKTVNVADHEDSDYRPEEDISGIDSIPEYNSTKQSNISRGMDVTKSVNVADHKDSDYRPEKDISSIDSIPEYNSTKQSNISRGMDITKSVNVADHEDSDYRPEEDISGIVSIPEYNSTKQSNISRGMDVTKTVNVADHEDSDYRPEEDISSIDSIPEYNSTKQSNISRGMDVTKSVNVADISVCNPANMKVEKSRGPKGDRKANFCFYCHKKQYKIARHLELKHKGELDVQKFTDLPKNSKERKEIISVIRKKGNFLFNTDTNLNDGTLIVSRRPAGKYNKTAENYMACGNCRAYFSESSLRAHFSKCTGRSSKKKRIVKIMGKRIMGRIHAQASDVVRRKLFPVLREDEIVRLVRYDALIIIYANKMCEKYKSSDHHLDMIRSRIRLIGRFLKTMKTLDKQITDLTSVYDPTYCNHAIKAINIEAGLNEGGGSYKAPTVASALGTLLKKVGELLTIECIKSHNPEKKQYVKDFLKVLALDLAVSVNKTVTETQTQQKRYKKTALPSMDDVKKLHEYLLQKRTNAFKQLQTSFSVKAWTNLAETTLTSLQLFNRRRAGEVERILIEDYRNYQSVDESTDKVLFNSLSKENQEAAKKYVRFTIRGKLNRTVPVLLDQNHVKCIEFILKYRKKMKISDTNPYVFGMKGSDRSSNLYLRACNLMRRFSAECGAEHPERLRGTMLRKHIATQCITLNLSEHQVHDLANFMGHAENIHKNIYRQPLVNREIFQMSRLLERAQGTNDQESNSSADSEDDNQRLDESNNFQNTNETVVTDNFNDSALQDVSIPSTSCAKLQVKCKTKKKRSTSPYGQVKRKRWSEKEKKIVLSLFGEGLKNAVLPSLKEIQKEILNNPCLKNRRPPQIKTWLHNQTKKKEFQP